MFYLFFILLWIVSSEIMTVHPKDKHTMYKLEALGLRKHHHKGVFEIDWDTEIHLIPRTRDMNLELQAEKIVVPPEYGTHEDLLQRIDDIVNNSNGIATSFDIGASHQGRILRVIQINVNPTIHSIRPIVRLIGNQHGDEVVGRELLVRYAQYIIDNIDIIRDVYGPIILEILPCMNPDGFANSTRGNYFGHDLNRAFPDPYSDREYVESNAPKEVQAVMNWIRTVPVNHVLSLVGNLHGGDLVCNYPRDTNAEHEKRYTATNEDNLYREVCKMYSKYNYDMYHSHLFDDGITNGASWYPLNGGLQDWVYDNFGVMSVTVEVGYKKAPEYKTITSKYFPENFGSLTRFVSIGQKGCYGRVTHNRFGTPSTISTSYGVRIFSNGNGDFGRIMETGEHELSVTTGYGSTRISCTVVGLNQTFVMVNV